MEFNGRNGQGGFTEFKNTIPVLLVKIEIKKLFSDVDFDFESLSITCLWLSAQMCKCITDKE